MQNHIDVYVLTSSKIFAELNRVFILRRLKIAGSDTVSSSTFIIALEFNTNLLKTVYLQTKLTTKTRKY